MKFIGHLFLRELLSLRVMQDIASDLLCPGEACRQADEHRVECFCCLLQTIGYTVEQRCGGPELLSQLNARLADLQRKVGPDGQLWLTTRVRFQIQDLLDLRRNG